MCHPGRLFFNSLLEDDEAAYELTMRLYSRRLLRMARSIARDDSEAEDIVQEAFRPRVAALRLFRRRSREERLEAGPAGGQGGVSRRHSHHEPGYRVRRLRLYDISPFWVYRHGRQQGKCLCSGAAIQSPGDVVFR